MTPDAAWAEWLALSFDVSESLAAKLEGCPRTYYLAARDHALRDAYGVFLAGLITAVASGRSYSRAEHDALHLAVVEVECSPDPHATLGRLVSEHGGPVRATLAQAWMCAPKLPTRNTKERRT